MTDQKVAQKNILKRLLRRKKHCRKKLYGSLERPRLVVSRSNRHIYGQLVNDLDTVTITGCSSLSPDLKEEMNSAKTKIEKAKIVGKHLAGLAKEKGINQISFDRNGRKYHGRVKALAEGARSGGLEF